MVQIFTLKIMKKILLVIFMKVISRHYSTIR
ncbi:unnamed protein product [Trichobilharzia regenti]|nr:unnamed protein product [Trichobilharzia regenti]